ncbi:MAG TPA: RNA polymerase sigma factor [Actinomycetota bacterium]|nr:RNA polymerase sigma factor [Actinomycetota bacterium]
MEVSAFQPSAANISAVSSDGNRGEPDGREHERALVARAKDGEQDAFGTLYRQHVAAVSRVVRFRLGREDEDAVSEVFLRAWRGLSTYRDTGVPFAAWLYGIARHVAVDVLRASARTEPRAELPDVEVDPMTVELLTLHDAIEQLPTEQRQVIELKYLVGMSNAEVAAAMDTSTGAINARQWRALKSLADVLEDRA